jgi:ketosteroid isomerase-like protein
LADYTNATSKNPNKEAYEDFIKHVPVKKASDTGNVRNEILKLFAEKLNLDKKMATPAPVAAPVTVSVAKPVAEPTVAPGAVAAVGAPAPVVAAESIHAVAAAPVAAAASVNLAQVNSKQSETKSIPEENVRNLVLKWAASWESGDMETYRDCYASNFQSKGMNINEWISYKTNVRQKSKNINIRIDDLQISANENKATAVFTQFYSSSILKDKGKKTLEMRKTGNQWKIYKEIM